MQPAIRAGRALLPLQKLLADNRERDVTAMRGSAVLEQKNSLPGAELHLAINNRHTLADARQDHPNVLLILQNPSLGRAISIKNIVQHRVCACSIPSCIKLMDWRVFSLPNDSRVAHPLT